MKVIKNPAKVEDQDLAKAYETALKFLKEKGFRVKKVKMVISPFATLISKLPMRQSTDPVLGGAAMRFSKLPMRQSTSRPDSTRSKSISKLPMRQSTGVHLLR